MSYEVFVDQDGVPAVSVDREQIFRDAAELVTKLLVLKEDSHSAVRVITDEVQAQGQLAQAVMGDALVLLSSRIVAPLFQVLETKGMTSAELFDTCVTAFERGR
ncbi:hypothetical protein JGU71_14005 [Antrihabitans sp. YC3-6]|uniref:Uncharacterized protein n=1 Tax=Antrihabitans stalagmiti TaxID=2799499 RepID=A0A934U406_9NOCA|nr:hypothetical protein [Antrihabitans stalagmiti]MBJ8340006.1 hypothetical protein [Antrihabitans stalagmiti]